MSTKSQQPFEQLSNELLIARVAQGEPNALAILYDRYAATILGLCLKITGDRADAERVLQEIFWQLWKGATTYEAQRGSFENWLFRLARDLAMGVHGQRLGKSNKK